MGTLQDLVCLIPCHSLEDFPSELAREEDAASLLAGYQVLWHPQLFVSAGRLPSWHRADDPPEIAPERFVVVPSICESFLPAGWVTRARQAGMGVVIAPADRAQLLLAVFDELRHRYPDALGSVSSIPSGLAEDFLALGFAYLQIQLVARHMRHFSCLDESQFQHEVLVAAQAAVTGQGETATEHLRNCFEVLTEARQRFYPVDLYLIDLCLLAPELLRTDPRAEVAPGSGPGALLGLGEEFRSAPVNILVCARDLEAVARQDGRWVELLREGLLHGRAEMCGGEYEEVDSTLLPLESLLWQFDYGARVYHEHLGQMPRVFGRRRFGLTCQLPQILARRGFHGAMHLVFDDGQFPGPEQSKIRWEGSDGQVIDALAQIPLPADDAITYLRFPRRLAETMDRDHVATLVLAHWPGVKAPWYHDLRRMARYSPVFGRFVSLSEYFLRTGSPGRLSQYRPDEYRSPYLRQAVARKELNPISRYVQHRQLRQRLDEAWWMATAAAMVAQGSSPDVQPLEDQLEQCAPHTGGGAHERQKRAEGLSPEIEAFHRQSAEALSRAVLAGAGHQPGYLLINPLYCARRVGVWLDGFTGPLPQERPVLASQKAPGGYWAVVELPAMGYVWLSQRPGPAAPPSRKEVDLVEGPVLRNEFFEAHIDPQTGGLRGIVDYRTGSNRLGEQLAFRFPTPSSPSGRSDTAGPDEVRYTRMVGRRWEVTANGLALGEITTHGELMDPAGRRMLARFQQRFRLWRSRSILEIEIRLEPERFPEAEPWASYYTARFAWPEEETAVCCSVLHQSYLSRQSRLESLDYVELSGRQERTAILTAGLPFHQRVGDRMLDTLLISAGEEGRDFRCGVAVDVPRPFTAAMDFLSPPIVLPTDGGPPRSGPVGWLMHLDAPNVAVTSVRPLAFQESRSPSEPAIATASKEPMAGLRMRLIETEGQPVRTKLRLCQRPVHARFSDLQGQTITELVIQDDAVVVDLSAHEIATIEVHWESFD